MTNASFDTYSATKALCDAGFDEIQAVATVSMVRDAMVENVASKTDMSELKFDMKSDMTAFKTEIKDEMSAFKTEIKDEMSEHRSDMKNFEARLTVRSYALALGIVVANTTLIITLMKLFL